MKHINLEALKNRILNAKTERTLEHIKDDCPWSNCAVGTKLRELGIDLYGNPADAQIVRRIVKPEFLKEGEEFNRNLIRGKSGVRKAIKFINKLSKTKKFDLLAPEQA